MNTTDNIRRLREESNLTQEDMAELLKTTRSNYAYLENRGDKLTIEQVRTIANALNRSLSELLDNSTDPLNKKELERIKALEAEIKDLHSENKTLRNSMDAYHMILNTFKESIMKEETNLEEAFEKDSAIKNVMERVVEDVESTGVLNNLKSKGN